MICSGNHRELRWPSETTDLLCIQQMFAGKLSGAGLAAAASAPLHLPGEVLGSRRNHKDRGSICQKSARAGAKATEGVASHPRHAWEGWVLTSNRLKLQKCLVQAEICPDIWENHSSYGFPLKMYQSKTTCVSLILNWICSSVHFCDFFKEKSI